MFKTVRSAYSSFTKRLCAILVCLLAASTLIGSFSAFATEPEAPVETEAPAVDTAAPSADEAPTLTSDGVKNIGELVKNAAAADKNSDTPRAKLTAAYLAGDLDAAKAAIKEANDAQKAPLVINYDSMNLADVELIIDQMKDTVDLEKSGGAIKNVCGAILRWMTNVLGGGNYIIGLLIFAIVVELALLPIQIKQQKNSIKQASLRPKEMAIRNRYKGRDDQVTKQKMTQEIQDLYQREGFNPAGGCLPLIIQMIIIFMLYAVVIDPLVYCMNLSTGVSNALMQFVNAPLSAGGLGMTITSNRGTIEIASIISEYGAEFFDKLEVFPYFTNGEAIRAAAEAATLPNFNLFGLNTGLVPSLNSFDWLLLVPVLTFVVYYGSMKITRKMTYQPVEQDQAAGCSNKMMDVIMPIFSAYICFIVPAALGIYWMFKSVLTTVIKIVLTKAMPIPTFTEEDYKAAEKELKGKPIERRASGVNRTTASGKPVRSLHHIDDEDFDDTREKALARKAAAEEAERRAAEEAEARAAASGMKSEDDRPMLSFKDMFKKKKNEKSEEKSEDASENNDEKTDK